MGSGGGVGGGGVGGGDGGGGGVGGGDGGGGDGGGGGGVAGEDGGGGATMTVIIVSCSSNSAEGKVSFSFLRKAPPEVTTSSVMVTLKRPSPRSFTKTWSAVMLMPTP